MMGYQKVQKVLRSV